MGNQNLVPNQIVTVSEGIQEKPSNFEVEEINKIKVRPPIATHIKGISGDLEKMWTFLKEKHEFRLSTIQKNQISLLEKCKDVEKSTKTVISPQIAGSIALLHSGKHSHEVIEDFIKIKVLVSDIQSDLDTLIEKAKLIDDQLT